MQTGQLLLGHRDHLLIGRGSGRPWLVHRVDLLAAGRVFRVKVAETKAVTHVHTSSTIVMIVAGSCLPRCLETENFLDTGRSIAHDPRFNINFIPSFRFKWKYTWEIHRVRDTEQMIKVAVTTSRNVLKNCHFLFNDVFFNLKYTNIDISFILLLIQSVFYAVMIFLYLSLIYVDININITSNLAHIAHLTLRLT